MTKKEFAERLTKLRINKGVSARDMSLSIGQSPGYINNIENGVSLPSMTVFFYICDYLEITPTEFFDVECSNPTKTDQLFEDAKELKDSQLDILINITKEMKK